jgi:hypothetical protein
MNSEGCETKRSCPNLRYCTIILLEGLKKTTEDLSQDNWPSGRNLSSGPPEIASRVLITLSRRLGSLGKKYGTKVFLFDELESAMSY